MHLAQVWLHSGKGQLKDLPPELWGVNVTQLRRVLDRWDPARVFSINIIREQKLYFASNETL
jgi:hypothetical protein